MLSWLIAFNVVNSHNSIVRTIWDFLYRVTEPALRPIRAILPNLGGIDISPVILIIALMFLDQLIIWLFVSAFALSERVRLRRGESQADGLMLTVRLTPRGGRDAIDGIEQLADGRSVLKVRVRAAASEGEANAALVRLIAKTLGVPAARCAAWSPARARGSSGCRSPAPGATLAAALEKICASRVMRSSVLVPGSRRDRHRRISAAHHAGGTGMTARIIDGKAIAADLRGKVADAVHRLARDRGIVPGLAVVLVGNNPASEIYVGSKMKMTTGSGMRSFDHRLPATTERSRAAGADRAAQRRSRPSTASWCSCRCRRRSMRRRSSPRSIRPRTSTASIP